MLQPHIVNFAPTLGIMHSLIVFASGTGTNTRAIIDHFKSNGSARVSLIVSNKPGAGVLEIAAQEKIPSIVVNKEQFSSEEFVERLAEYKPDLIVLAGFLWKIPEAVVAAFRDRIINIHPALLPSYGGKGMYGANVHKAVIGAKDKESGISIHYVNEVYDSGDVILQARCRVEEDDTHETLAARIHQLEHFFFPRTIEYLLSMENMQKTQ